MCGIAGFINLGLPGFDAEATIREMTNSMSHRGPDGMGFEMLSYDEDVNRSCVAMGHRRLKIIDLSENARQPMSDLHGTYSITYNGEVYNYIELRDELEKKGHSFVSASDTEVILKAYEEWDTDCFRRFNGMWALAIFDKAGRRVVLSRDRFGKKPLYYFKTESSLVFASEIKALLKHPLVGKKPNYEKIFRYISTNYRYVDIDYESYFADILQVPKSSYMEINDSLNINVRQYWILENNVHPRTPADEDAVHEFRELLTDSVRIRLRSDVPVGCFLSGGMDSTSVTCIAHKVLKTPIVTFSGITGNARGVYDESEYIDAVVHDMGAVHHYIRPDPADVFEMVDEMLSFHDEPICTVTWYSLYLLAKKMRNENVTVILNGHGGDEMAGGYWDYYQYNFNDLGKTGNTEDLSNEIACWYENHHRDMQEIERYKDYIKRLENCEMSEMSRFPDYSDCFTAEFAAKYRCTITLPKPFSYSFLMNRMYSDLMFETIPASLRAEDRNTMSQSLESRSPFLDYRIAEFCFSLPNNLKIRDGVGKWLLREAMKGILPEKVRTRKDKAGFIAPADEWFRTVNRQQFLALTDSGSFRDRGIFNTARIRELFGEHVRKEKNHQMLLWQIVNLELWFRRFF